MPSSRPTRQEPQRTDRGAIERLQQLDLQHRKRLRSAARLTLSLRFLAAAWGRLCARTQAARTVPVSPPPEGTVAVTFVGHATVMVTTPRTRVLTDPLLEDFFFGLRRATAAGIDPGNRDAVDLILISHPHRDHLHPRSLRRLPRTARVVVPPRCASLVTPLGFADVTELEPGATLTHQDVQVTAVPARHAVTRGLGDYARRGAAGFVVRSQGTTLYFAGDTGYFSGFTEIGRRFHPDVALLPIGGYEPSSFRDEHLSPLDAIYAFEDLGARVLIPITHGSFPLSYEPLDAPGTWLRQLARQRGLAGSPGDEDRRHVAFLSNGETCAFRRR